MVGIIPLQLWIERLSLFAFPKVIRFIRQNRQVRINYISATPFAIWASRYFKILGNVFVEKIIYSLGDMKIENLSAGIRSDLELAEIAHKIRLRIENNSAYKKLSAYLPKEKCDLFFEMIIYYEIYSVVNLFFVIEAKSQQNSRREKHILLCPESPVARELKSVLPERVALIDYYFTLNYITAIIKKLIKVFLCKTFFLRGIIMGQTTAYQNMSCIALHFAEGVDINKRSDIFWFHESKIEPKRVFMYFDLNKPMKHPVPKEVCETVERMNIGWFSLHRRAISGYYHRFKNRRHPLFIKGCKEFRVPRILVWTPLEVWIALNFEMLFSQTKMWIKLYTLFNIKIVFDISAQFPELIPQNIALDFVGGIRTGAQRSTMKTDKSQYFLRYNPNHLFFVWGEEAEKHRGTSHLIREFIVSGYPFDSAFCKDWSKEAITTQADVLHKNGRFVVALFDNTFESNAAFSENIITLFYKRFLEWLIEDEKVVIISKEKKTGFFERLTGIQNISTQAKRTGRFIRLEKKEGYLPVIASSNADMAVGVGISSAVMESVITGCRGIHCDLPGHHFHPYYEWGYEKIIFDDVNRLISVLKRYKENPQGEAALGDWSSYIDKLEPFRDGRAGERIGTYMRWLLESFDTGKNREETIQYANEQYVKQWGEDKVIDMRNRKEDF